MLSPGRRIGRYEVIGLLGRGGMAAVYRVRHVELGSIHALKLLSVNRERIRDRLLQEGRAQATLVHPNVVRVTDVLTSDDQQPVLVMEFVEGPTLERWLETRGRPTLGTAIDLAIGIARGLHAAHACGLVHRDLKPANVLLAPEPGGGWIPKIADFGLVKVQIEDAWGGSAHTRVGSAMGTPEFMAPEQMRDASSVDARADLFSLGCVLYTMLAGRLPFEGTNLLELHQRIRAEDYVPLDAIVPGLPPALIDLVESCLRPDPADRPASCAAVLAALEGVAVRLPSGPGTCAPAELLALARGAGPAWERAYGRDPRAMVVPPERRGRSSPVVLAVPVIAALAALAIPPAPVEAGPEVSLEEAGVGAVPEVVVPPVAAPSASEAPEEAPARRRPGSRRATVRVEGDATRVWLVQDGVRTDVPGPVPPGAYDIVALFPGTEPVTAGRIEIGTAPVVIKCAAFVQRCR